MKAINIQWDKDGEDIDLPAEIEIPDGMTDMDEISDYLSYQTGFCHYGFKLTGCSHHCESPNDYLECMNDYYDGTMMV